MSQVAICTDSSALLSEAAAVGLAVDVVPVAVTLDGEPFDDHALPIDDFYESLSAGAVALTSQPSPADFVATYERAAWRGAESVVSIHLDARASGTVTSAEIAARSARLPVRVVEARTVNFGVGVCVRTGAKVAARGGGSAHDVVAAATRIGALMENAFVARGAPGGRVPHQRGWTVLRFAAGASTLVAECSSTAHAVEEIARSALGGEQVISAAVGYAGREMEAFADELAHNLAGSERAITVERYRLGPAVGAHTGPHSFGAFWWPVD